MTDDGAVWSWLFQSVTEEEGLPLAKVSSSVIPEEQILLSGFLSNQIQMKFRQYTLCWRIEHNTKSKIIFLM